MNKNIIIISPHPDDETLGAGGTLLRYKDEGKKVFWLNITDMKSEYGHDKNIVKKRQNEIQKAKQLYDFNGFYNLKLKPMYLDYYPKSQIITKISKVINEVKPSTVILPYREDIHSDHKVVFDCTYSCTKIFRYPFIKNILCMETVSETDFALPDKVFTPNYFVDISNYLDKKIDIMKIYESEIDNHPFPRSEESIRALSTIRGAQAGCKYAEAFKLIKWIE